MKANELRVQNWIMANYTSSGWKAHQIKKAKEIDTINNSKEYKPIPLDESWLVRLGFNDKRKYNGEWYVAVNNYLIILHYEKGRLAYALNTSQFKYVDFVHEIQNITHALTGEELNLQK